VTAGVIYKQPRYDNFSVVLALAVALSDTVAAAGASVE